jgi:hypothetical protein
MHEAKYDLPIAAEAMGVVSRQIDWGEMTIAVEKLPAGIDTAPIFHGLPDDRCQCPHWGYVVKGQFRAVYADREETITAGDVYYLAPGHTAIFDAETEVIEFSPKGRYAETMEVVARNVSAMLAS